MCYEYNLSLFSFVCEYIHNTICSPRTHSWFISCAHFERTLYPRHVFIFTMLFTHILCSPHSHSLSLSFHNWSNIIVLTMCSTWTLSSSTCSMNSTSALIFRYWVFALNTTFIYTCVQLGCTNYPWTHMYHLYHVCNFNTQFIHSMCYPHRHRLFVHVFTNTQFIYPMCFPWTHRSFIPCVQL